MNNDKPLFPQWCIDRAKELAERRDDEQWLAYLDEVAQENIARHGRPWPPKDPEREALRQKAAERQRVIAAERFIGGDDG